MKEASIMVRDGTQIGVAIHAPQGPLPSRLILPVME
jgi:hypothetical protein